MSKIATPEFMNPKKQMQNKEIPSAMFHRQNFTG